MNLMNHVSGVALMGGMSVLRNRLVDDIDKSLKEVAVGYGATFKGG